MMFAAGQFWPRILSPFPLAGIEHLHICGGVGINVSPPPPTEALVEQHSKEGWIRFTGHPEYHSVLNFEVCIRCVGYPEFHRVGKDHY